MKILFVCKHNCFRSKVAEAYFNKINQNKSIKAKSAGLIKGSKVREKTIKAVKELGIKIKCPARGISSKLLKWQNMLVIVADNVPSNIFLNKKFGKPLIVWKIKDTSDNKKEQIQKISKEIMRRVDLLNKLIKNENNK